MTKEQLEALKAYVDAKCPFHNSKEEQDKDQDDYKNGYFDGFHNAKLRIARLLRKFPMQTAMLIPLVDELHPTQPSKWEDDS